MGELALGVKGGRRPFHTRSGVLAGRERAGRAWGDFFFMYSSLTIVVGMGLFFDV